MVWLLQLFLIPSSLARDISVLTYNIYMRPFFQDGQRIRAEYLAAKLSGFDALVFQEAYDDRIRGLLLDRLHDDYPFSTDVLGEDAGIRQDGGVIILSKWPILRRGERVFTAGTRSDPGCPGPNCCRGLDCLADKGVVYALINKEGHCFHLFGTHLQASPEHWRLRNAQMKVIERFIASQGIPHDEPVIIAGDMNIDRYDEVRYDQLRRLLKARQPPLKATAPRTAGKIYTFDGPRNDLNDNEGTQRYIDYVLYSVDHLPPRRAFNQVRIIRTPEPWRARFWSNWRSDLSDHYAVLGHFGYGRTLNGSCSAIDP